MALNSGPLPLYYQLAQDLRTQITSKKLKPGDPLPTEERLCEQYAVSRITVRRAVDDLINENLVVRRRGVGTFVGSAQTTRSVSLVGSLYEALSYPKGISIEVLRRNVNPTPNWVAETLQIREKAKVYCCEVLSRCGKTPFGATKFYFPVNIGQRIPFDELSGENPVARLVETVIGEPVVRAEQIVEPCVADASLAKALSVTKGTPLLNVLRTYYSASGKPVEAVSVHYRPDQYQLKVALLPNKT